jgi:arabinogalactan endo-1,4-beta-galactosidase
MILGVDASTQLEVEAKHPKYTYQGKPIDPWAFAHDHNGVSSMRLRLWLDPFSPEGAPYGGGTNDYKSFVLLARRALKAGYTILLDLHYSDFWCDPSKQTLPKAWAHCDLDQAAAAVYAYTRKTLLDAKRDGIPLIGLQIGNEITNGMLWPLGKLSPVEGQSVRSGYDALTKLLKAGVKAAREVDPKLPLIIHLENSGNIPLHHEFFSEVLKRGLDFDIIGLSYYPYWHGPFEGLAANIDYLSATFHKPIWIVETGYGFTLEPYVNEGGFHDPLLSEKYLKNLPSSCQPYPLSQEGQRDFLDTLLPLAEKHGVKAIYYWEPFWLPLKGLNWANPAGEAYTHELNKPTANEWANQCLFDYSGAATLAFDHFKIR